MAGRRVARFEITPNLLFQHWPKDMRVLDARVAVNGNLEILIEHPRLKETGHLVEGEPQPSIRPTFKHGAPAIHMLRDAPVSESGTGIHEDCVILTVAERDRIVAAIEADVPEFKGWGQE